MIKNNNNNITSITLTSDYGRNYIPVQMTNSVTQCRYLQEFDMSNVQLCNVRDSTNNSNYNDNNNNNKLVNLKQLTLRNINVDLSSFKSLLQSNMLKLEKLILNDIDITVNSKKINDNVKIDINPNFVNIKYLFLGKSNGNWHERLLNNLNHKMKRVESGSKLQTVELNVCQISRNTATIHGSSDHDIRFDRMKKLIIISLKEDNPKNSIYNALASVGHLTKLKIDDDDDELIKYTSDIETLEIEYDVDQSDGFDITDLVKILNTIEFTKLKSIIFYVKRHFIFHQCRLESKSDADHLNDLLNRIHTIDQFVSDNQSACIKIMETENDGGAKSSNNLYCYYVFGTRHMINHKKPSEIDSILNKKNKWDQIGNILSKWCNSNDMDSKLRLTLQFQTWLFFGSDVKVNGNTLCAKVKWINTMINSLCMSKNKINFGDMITKNASIVDNLSPYYECNTQSKFDIRLNNCITINGTIKEKDQFCSFEIFVVINLS